MPAGVYLHLDAPTGTPVATERFHCAAGPAGWRYVGAVTDPLTASPLGGVDITVDSRWRQLRVELSAGGWVVRGGLARELTWVRTPAGGGLADNSSEQASEHSAVAAAFLGRSPGLLVAAARLLGLAVGARTRLLAVALIEPVLAARQVEQGWTLLDRASHPTDSGPLVVERYDVADLATGERSQLHLAGDVLLAGPGVELAELTGSPTATRLPGS